MRFGAVLLVAFACSGAFASEPGQPLDCTDFVFTDASYSCVHFSRPCPDIATCPMGGEDRVADNTGAIVYLRHVSLSRCDCDSHERWRLEIHRFDGIADTVLGFLEERCFGPQVQKFHDAVWAGQPEHPGLVFDRANGRLLIRFASYSPSSGCASGTSGVLWIAAIQGFASTFDVLQTYTPQTGLGFRVPYMPEGMGGADHFDTYWGTLSKPLDFTQAHPLQCDYPSSPPHVGEYLTVADTVPTPVPGQGVYYVTAATYQGATRYGRKTTAGHLSGRDPAVLPACTP